MSLKGPRWNEVTAIFGGTFDPPHLGHREAVRGVFENPGVSRVWIIPSAAPPQKPGMTAAEHRVAMAKLNFASTFSSPLPGEIQVDLRELERAQRNGGRPSYTFETLSEIRKDLKQIAFVIGTDQLSNLPTWYRFPEVLGLSHWIVLARMPGGMDPAMAKLREWEASGLARRLPGGDSSPVWKLQAGETYMTVVPTPAPALSSTAIREEIGRTGQAPSGTLLAEVSEYLKRHCLYGSDKAHETEDRR